VDVVIVGLGYVGLPLAIQAAKSGFSVTGFDIDSTKIFDLNRGQSILPEINSEQLLGLIEHGNLHFVNKLEKKSKTSIFVIAVPTPLNENREPDLRMLEAACFTIAGVVQDGDLVINESTSYIGTLRYLIKPIIQKESSMIRVKFAVAPERIDPGNKVWTITNTPRNVAGLTKDAGQEVVKFYEKICNQVILLSSPEEAEAAKLIENAFRQINIAFINEVAKLASRLDFSIHNAIKAASTKPFGFMPFYPSIGVGGHCIPVDSHYLTYSADKVGMLLESVDIANKINLSMATFIVEEIMKVYNFEFKDKLIQIAGIAYKSNSSDVRESPALVLMRLMRAKGAEVIWHDPLVNTFADEKSVALQADVDMGLIISPHDDMDFSIWKSQNKFVLDLSPTPKNLGWDKFI
jgi:UDP-N-acetyl-D-glucosamine dehydrogenase